MLLHINPLRLFLMCLILLLVLLIHLILLLIRPTHNSQPTPRTPPLLRIILQHTLLLHIPLLILLFLRLLLVVH